MKQVSVTPRLRSIGGLLNVVKQTLSLFSVFLIAITLLGWHSLVFYRYVENFWVFASLLLFVFTLFALAQYFILTPVETAFLTEQTFVHGEEARRKTISELVEELNRK